MVNLVTSPFLNKILYCVGAFSSYDVNNGSFWRSCYQMSILCFISSMYFFTMYLNIQSREMFVDPTLQNLNPKAHSIDVAMITGSLMLQINFIYLFIRILYGMTRFRKASIIETFLSLENLTREINYMKSKLGMKPKKFDLNDTIQIMFYLFVWLSTWAVDYGAARASPMSFVFGFTFICNLGWLVCVLVDHIFFCCLKLMTFHFHNIKTMLALLLEEGDFYAKRNMDYVVPGIATDIKIKNIRAIFILHR